MGDRRLFALSDPHLSFASAKPMDVFGPRWNNYVEKIRANWFAKVNPGDIVLLPGDISWGMRLEEALPDLNWLAELPGVKIFLKGNHDYWWQSIKKIRALELPSMYFIQNDSVVLDGLAVGGARLWDFPDIHWRFVRNPDKEGAKKEGRSDKRGEDDEKIRERELSRLALSLGQLPENAQLRIAMTHYPPLSDNGKPTAITDIINRFNIDICVFGHVHALPEGEIAGADVVIGGTRFVLAASDYLDHSPKYLCDLP